MANAKNSKTAKTAAVKTVKKEGATYTFGGEYYCREDKGLSSKAYELSVTFPELLKAPLSVFKKGVSTVGHPIRNLMVKKYPDYTSIRTFNVIGVVNNTNSKPPKADDISVMDIEQLKHYISENDLSIDVEVYDSQIDKVREAIHLAQSDPEKFEKVYAEDVKEYEYRKQLEELNSGSDSDNSGEGESGEGGDGIDDLLGGLDGDSENGEGENGTNE